MRVVLLGKVWWAYAIRPYKMEVRCRHAIANNTLPIAAVLNIFACPLIESCYMSQIFFTVGPAHMYPTVQHHVATFFTKQLGSVSHRSTEFRVLHNHTVEQLRLLMGIPPEFEIYFSGSASELWERIIINCVRKESYHVVQGAFAKRFYEYALEVGKHPTCTKVPNGETILPNQVQVPPQTELIALTYNETSTGVQLQPDVLTACRAQNPQAITAVDIVSCAPISPLDFNTIDIAFFSVQKGFGLPAGLGVWIVHPRCVERALQIQAEQSIGAHNTLPKHHRNFLLGETPSTPNVLGIYLLGKVAEDMNTIGIQTIRHESAQKAEYLYAYFDNHPTCTPFVQNKKARSETVITLRVQNPAHVLQYLASRGLRCSSGYGDLKDSTIRIANFPAHSFADVQQLCAAFDTLPT